MKNTIVCEKHTIRNGKKFMYRFPLDLFEMEQRLLLILIGPKTRVTYV